MITKRSWSSGEGEAVCPGSSVAPFKTERMVAFVCLPAVSSIWNRLSSPRSLMDCNNAVAMFMCVSRICLRAVSSGKAVMAVFKFAVLDVKSIWETSLTSLIPVDRVISAASVLYLLRSVSISSATAGKGLPAFLAQKKSLESIS